MEPLSNRPIITIKDIGRGYVMRYFVKNTSTKKLTEVDKSQYLTFSQSPNYQVLEIRWTITGIVENKTNPDGKKVYGVKHQNTNIIEFYEKKMSGLRYMLPDVLEYYKGIGVSS